MRLNFCLLSFFLLVCWTAESFQTIHQRQGLARRSTAAINPFHLESFSSFESPRQPTRSASWNKKSSSSSSSSAMSLFRSEPSAESSRNTAVGIFRRILKGFMEKSKLWNRIFKRSLLAATLFFSLLFTSFSVSSSPAWAAAGPSGVRSRTGGRSGGSFGPSPSRSYRPPSKSYSSPPTRSYSSPPTRIFYQPSPRLIITPPTQHHVHVYGSPTESNLYPTMPYARPAVQRPTASDIMLITGTGLLVTYGVMKHYRDKDDDYDDYERSPLGPGVSVLSLTVALNVPDRFDKNSVLARLKDRARWTDSSSRKSVQRLVSDTALELLRQDRAIVSVGSEYKHFKNYNDAEREFNKLSLLKRSKFDRETFDNFNGEQISTGQSMSDDGLKSTTAVIDLSVCIEGDSTRVSDIKNRAALKDALYRISADAQVEDCLVAAEVLWTPDDGTDSMTQEDVFADYPSLYPLYD